MAGYSPLCLLLWALLTIGESWCQTTVPVYLPDYSPAFWSAVRGSVISSNAVETHYTVFCAPTPQECVLAGDLPFTFAEGPGTVHYEGTITSTLTAELGCKFGERTDKATCTGSSVLAKDYTLGPHTGPTDIKWTSTFTEMAAQWGVLTLATPSPTSTWNIEATAEETVTTLTKTVGSTITVVTETITPTAQSNGVHVTLIDVNFVMKAAGFATFAVLILLR